MIECVTCHGRFDWVAWQRHFWITGHRMFVSKEKEDALVSQEV